MKACLILAPVVLQAGCRKLEFGDHDALDSAIKQRIEHNEGDKIHYLAPEHLKV